MTAGKLTVAVTGAAGYLASKLIGSLCADERVERVLGFDLRPPAFAHEKLVFDVMDVRSPALEKRLVGADVIVHLAFVMNPIKDESHMRDVNVNGSQNVFACAGAAGVRQIIYTSSATVYGAHPDNDLPLSEDSPLRANLDFSYPAHKLEVEYIVKEFRPEHPDVVFTMFRPAIVYGPHTDNAWSHWLEGPVLLGVKGFDPPWQFVHEDDVGRALLWAVGRELDGPYNLAPRGWLAGDEAMAIVGRSRSELSEPVAFKLMERLWRLGLVEAPPGMLHYVMYPWVMSVQKLTEAGFVCEKSNADSLAEAVAVMREFVRFGKVRMRRSDVRRGLVAAAGMAAAAAVVGGTRRTRHELG